MVRHYHCRIVWLTLAGVWLNCAAADDAMVSHRIVADGIPEPLAARGDAARGKRVAADAERGNCLICHAIPIAEAPVFGTVGPDLNGIGQRLSAAQLRLRVVNPKALNPNTAMPAYHHVQGLHRVAQRYAQRPILSAQEVEDVVAYLQTLK